MKWLPQNWNDAISVPLVVLLPVLFVYVYATGVALPEIVVGGLMAGWTLAVQHYYRKKQGGE